MIEEQALVKALHNDNVVLEVERQNACHSCELSAGCGTGSLGRLLGHKTQKFTIRNTNNLKKGDRVIIGLPENSYLSAGFLIYLLPLIFLFLFAGISHIVFENVEWLNVVSALLGLGVGILMAARLAKQNFSEQLQPRVIRQIW